MLRVVRPYSASSQVPSEAPAEPSEVTVGPEVTIGRPGWLMLLDSGLDAVRIVTACLAAYQATRHAGLPAVSGAPWLDALSLWQLIGIYVASVVVSLALGGRSAVGSALSWARAKIGSPARQGAPSDDATDDSRAVREP